MYDQHVQFAPVESILPTVLKPRIVQVQSKIGNCLYYDRDADPTILAALDMIISQFLFTDVNPTTYVRTYVEAFPISSSVPYGTIPNRTSTMFAP